MNLESPLTRRTLCYASRYLVMTTKFLAYLSLLVLIVRQPKLEFLLPNYTLPSVLLPSKKITAGPSSTIHSDGNISNTIGIIILTGA